MTQIRVAVLDDHQSIIDGYVYRLSTATNIQVVATATHGEDLDPMLEKHAVNVLLLDVSVPSSVENRNPFPVLHVIPRILQRYPHLSILIISMFTQRSLIEALIKTGISGYVFKDDQASIQQLAKIIAIISNGGNYFSPGIVRDLQTGPTTLGLTARQLEVLSLCNAHPDGDTRALAKQLGITGSTLRNLLSGAYARLGVRTRAAAIAKAQDIGILPILSRISSTGSRGSRKR